ncbi:hypothetical protein ACLOJK_025665 [Asimina triloba]
MASFRWAGMVLAWDGWLVGGPHDGRDARGRRMVVARRRRIWLGRKGRCRFARGGWVMGWLAGEDVDGGPLLDADRWQGRGRRAANVGRARRVRWVRLVQMGRGRRRGRCSSAVMGGWVSMEHGDGRIWVWTKTMEALDQWDFGRALADGRRWLVDGRRLWAGGERWVRELGAWSLTEMGVGSGEIEGRRCWPGAVVGERDKGVGWLAFVGCPRRRRRWKEMW